MSDQKKYLSDLVLGDDTQVEGAYLVQIQEGVKGGTGVLGFRWCLVFSV